MSNLNISTDKSKTAYAKVRSIRVSPRKLSLMANLIKNMDIANAFFQLSFSKKAIARKVTEVLRSAVYNAENNHNLNIDKLYVSLVLVGKSYVLKRFTTRGRGRGAPIKKPCSNLTVFVTERY